MPLPGIVRRHLTGHRQNRVLGGAIGDHLAIVLHARVGRGDDDAAATLAAHRRDRGLRGHEMRPDVEVPRRIHVGDGDLLELALDLDAGVGMQDVEPPVPLRRGRRWRSAARRRRSRRGPSHPPCRPFADALRPRPRRRPSIRSVTTTMRALARHRFAPGGTDARRGTGDEGDPVLQQHDWPPLLSVSAWPRRRMSCAMIRRISEAAITIVPIALISGVTPRRIEEKT
jgi:hypothetical protein